MSYTLSDRRWKGQEGKGDEAKAGSGAPFTSQRKAEVLPHTKGLGKGWTFSLVPKKAGRLSSGPGLQGEKRREHWSST